MVDVESKPRAIAGQRVFQDHQLVVVDLYVGIRDGVADVALYEIERSSIFTSHRHLGNPAAVLKNDSALAACFEPFQRC